MLWSVTQRTTDHGQLTTDRSYLGLRLASRFPAADFLDPALADATFFLSALPAFFAGRAGAGGSTVGFFVVAFLVVVMVGMGWSVVVTVWVCSAHFSVVVTVVVTIGRQDFVDVK